MTRDEPINPAPDAGFEDFGGRGIYRGLTNRDHVAIEAMKGMINGSWPDSTDRTEIARRSYAMADAMLAESIK